MKTHLNWLKLAALPLLALSTVGAASEKNVYYVSPKGSYELTDFQLDRASEERRPDGTLYRRALLKAGSLKQTGASARVLFEEEDYPEGGGEAGRWILTDLASRTRYTFTESDDGSSFVIQGGGDVLSLSFPSAQQQVVNGTTYPDFQSGYAAARSTAAWRNMPPSIMFTVDGLLANPLAQFGRGLNLSCPEPKMLEDGNTVCRTPQVHSYTAAGAEEKAAPRLR